MSGAKSKRKQCGSQPAPIGEGSQRCGSQPAPADGSQPVPGVGSQSDGDTDYADMPQIFGEDGDQSWKRASSQTMSPQEFLKEFSSERRLIPLNRLGVHQINRKGKPLNGAQVLSLMMRFRKGSQGGGEDFQTYRYSPARVVEPDPSDLGATARHTNAMAAIDHRIRGVDDPTNKGLFGLFSKSHLWSAVWGMTGRCVKEDLDPDAPYLEPPKDQPDFAFAEENGLWCEVVRWEGAKRYPEVLEQLMRSENFDATSALAEDEVTFLDDILGIINRGVVTAVGEREYDAVARTILATPGQSFTAKDVEPRYNLAKVLGKTHLEFLSRYCTLWVDFKTITIPNKALQALTKLPPKCPWLKICLMCDNYMTAEPKTRVGGKGVADNWGLKEIDDIMETMSGLQLGELETIPAAFLDAYRAEKIPNASPELLYKTQCRFLVRVGAALRGKKRDEWRDELARYEASLRTKFADGQLPPHVLKLAPAASSQVTKKEAKEQSAASSQVDESPALQFDDHGKVKDDMSCLARSQGLAVGSACSLVKNVKGAKRNRLGTVTRIEETGLTVTFSADDEAGLAEVTLTCALNVLKAVDPPKAKKAKVEKAADAKPVADGAEWKSYDEGAVKVAVKHHMTSFLQQLRIQHAPAQQIVALYENPPLMVAKEELQPLALRIIPNVHDLRLAASGEVGDVTVDFKGGGETVQFTMLEEEDKGMQMQGTTMIIDPYDFIAASSNDAREYAGGCAELTRVASGVLSVPFNDYTTADAPLRPTKASKLRLECKIHYWTNAGKVPRGSALALAPQPSQ